MSGLTWDDLEHSLAVHLAAMPDDAMFTFYVDEQARPGFDPEFDGYPRYVQCLKYDGTVLRCEVVSNTYLPPDMHHTVDDLIALRTDGWQLPADVHVHGSPNLFIDVEEDDAPMVAAMVMRVFRQVWRVAEAGGVTCDADKLRGRHAFRLLAAPDDFRTRAPLH